jgi:Ca-activated chloride channel family protein
MRPSLRLLLLFAMVTLTGVLAAQVRVDVRLVNVVATVTDNRGRYITNLTREDFVLEEDGRPQEITHFSQGHTVPVSVGIVLDTSGSMDRKIRTAIDAVDRFIRQIHEDDEAFLITFSGEPVLRQDFTADRDKLSQALRRIPATGGTALYDALTTALLKIRSGRHNKRALLVITDGQDTSSAAKLDEVLQRIRESQLLVYPVGISPLTYAQGRDTALPLALVSQTSSSKRDEVDIKVLGALAESSGGRAFLLAESFVARGAQIEKVLETIANELRSQYTLGYYPPHPDDGRYHSIRVRSKAGGTVRARRGYIAGGS